MNRSTIAKHVIKRVLEPSDNKALQRPVDQAAQRHEPEIALQKKKHWWSKRAEAEIVLSPHESKILKKVKRQAHYLDRGIHCCCFAIGLDGLVGKCCEDVCYKLQWELFTSLFRFRTSIR
jgi:hypothetical protein